MSERIRKPVRPKPASRWPGLRYAVASSEWTIDSKLTKNAAYGGPHLLVIAHSSRHLSSPGKASAIAVEQLRRLDVPAGPPDLAGSLERGIQGLRETFRELLAGNRDWAGNVTELTAMLWRGADAAIAHIGSTRAYMLRGGDLTQLARDHTLGQLLIEAGEITPDELGSDHRHSDVITRWLDADPGEPADIIVHEAAAGP